MITKQTLADAEKAVHIAFNELTRLTMALLEKRRAYMDSHPMTEWFENEGRDLYAPQFFETPVEEEEECCEEYQMEPAPEVALSPEEAVVLEAYHLKVAPQSNGDDEMTWHLTRADMFQRLHSSQ